MNCYKHPEVAAVAYCRTCGKPLCGVCQRPLDGSIVCEEHAPPQQPGPPPAAQPQPSSGAPYAPPPGLAFGLGFIPGVGAIYNGQYAKGIIHVVIFGVLIGILSSDVSTGWVPLFAMLLAAWCFYMPFEAYHTARKRRMGLPADEFSSLFRMDTGGTQGCRRPHRIPIGPIILIGVGVLFLLDTLGILHAAQIWRFWPLILIGIGISKLIDRVGGSHDGPPPPPSGGAQ
jgi:hypothetical protein